jgi:predicted ATPase with chaperone activity
MLEGELSLDGRITSVRGTPAAQTFELKRLILPATHAAEAAVVEGIKISQACN